VSVPVALPSLPLLPASASPAASDPTVIVLEGPPDILAALAASGQIAGTVTQEDGQGALVLLTALGTLSIKPAVTLAIGSRIVMQPLSDRPGTVLVLAVNDVATSPRAAPAAPLPSAPPSPAAPPPALLDLGTTITATVLAAVPGAEPPPQADAPVPPQASAMTGLPIATSQPGALPPVLTPGPPAPATGTPQAQVQAQAQTLPSAPAVASSSVPSTLGVAAALLAETVATARSPVPASPTGEALAPLPVLGGTSRTLPPGTTVTVRILAVQPATTPGVASEPALTGTVVASPAGEKALMVDTPAGIVRLFATTPPTAVKPVVLPLAPGTSVALRLTEEPAGGILAVLRPQAPAVPNVAPTVLESATPAAQGQAAKAIVSTNVAPAAAQPAEFTGTTKATSSLSAEPSSAAAPVTYRVVFADASRPNPAPGAPADPRVLPQPVIGTVLRNRAAMAATATLIATPLGTLAVTKPLALPAGTLLLLVPPDDLPGLAMPALGRPGRLDKGWPALEATLAALAQAAPELSVHLRTDLSAQSGERLAAGLMFLVAALQAGPSRAWPGDAVEHALAVAGRSDLKLRLGEEFAEIRAIADNPATGAWQVFLLPLIEGATVRPVRLYLKRRGERKRRAASEDAARFVLEFELTRLGMLQLDGFVRPQRFDLVLRSHAALDAPLRAGVERIFYERVGAAGLAGTIDFATAPRFDIAPLDKLRGPVGLAV